MGMNLKKAMFAGFVGLLTALCAAGGFAWMMHQEILNICHMNLAAAGCLILGGGAAGLLCARGEGRIKTAAVGELVLILMLGMINLALFEGELQGAVPCVLLLAGTGAGVVLAFSGKRSTAHGKYRGKKGAMGKLNKKYRR